MEVPGQAGPLGATRSPAPPPPRPRELRAPRELAQSRAAAAQGHVLGLPAPSGDQGECPVKGRVCGSGRLGERGGQGPRVYRGSRKWARALLSKDWKLNKHGRLAACHLCASAALGAAGQEGGQRRCLCRWGGVHLAVLGSRKAGRKVWGCLEEELRWG